MTNSTIPRFSAAVVMTVLVLAAALPVAARAQTRTVDVTPTVSYMWGGSFETVEGEIMVQDGVQYGGIINVPVSSHAYAEFTYAFLSSRATFSPYYVGKPSTLDGLDIGLNVHYFQLGMIQQMDKGRMKPFVGFAMGAVLFHPKEARYNEFTLQDTWRFAVSMSGGVKIWLSDMVALRLQGRLFLPIYFNEGGLWVGTGGVSVGVSGGIPIVQGDLGAGLTITL